MSDNRVHKILIDMEINAKTILRVLNYVLPLCEDNWRICEQKFKIYNMDFKDLIVNADGKYNEKRNNNLGRTCIKLKAGVTMNEPILLQTSSENKTTQVDTEIIKSIYDVLGDQKVSMDILVDMLVCGIGFSYTLPNDNNDKPVIKGRFSPTDTFCIHSNSIGNPVALSIHKANITVIDEQGNPQTIEEYTCFDDKYAYTVQKGDDGELRLVNKPVAYNMPNNPITMYIYDDSFVSLLDELLPIMISYALASSNLDNDMLKKINNMLVVAGFALDDEDVDKIFKKEANLITVPPATETQQIPQIYFLSSNAVMSDIMTYKANLWQEALDTAFLPKDSGARVETGNGAKFSGNYVVTTMMCGMLELTLADPKRKELENIVTLLKRKHKISQKTNSSDIRITFDHNRLLDISELSTTMLNLKNVGLDIDDILDIVGVATNNVKIADGTNRQALRGALISTIASDSLLTLDEKINKIKELYKG